MSTCAPAGDKGRVLLLGALRLRDRHDDGLEEGVVFRRVVVFSGYDGNFKPYTAPDDELRLDDEQAEALVAYAKKTLKQRWAPKPIPHKLRGVWADLPAGTWLLPNA